MTIEQDVKNWLADEGVFREKAADENADFHFVIEFPKDNVMDVVKPKEKDVKVAPDYFKYILWLGIGILLLSGIIIFVIISILNFIYIYFKYINLIFSL